MSLGLTSVQMGDLLVPFSGFVYCFSLDFLDCDVQSDIHRVCRWLCDPRFLVQVTGADGLVRVALDRDKRWFASSCSA
jgi:hypothetical protein